MSVVDKLINRLIMSALIHKGNKGIREIDEKSKNAIQINKQLLLDTVKKCADTEYGRKFHFSEIKTIEDYKRLVPFSTYDDYAPYIERMIMNNEKNLITANPIVHYAVSSGSVGVPKRIPVSKDTKDLYSKFGYCKVLAATREYYRKKTGKSYPYGKGINLVEAKPAYAENGVTTGAISSTIVAKVKKFLPYIVHPPAFVSCADGKINKKYLVLRYALQDPDLVYFVAAFMTALVDLMHYMEDNWEILVNDIAEGTISDTVDLPADIRENALKTLRPNPQRAKELKKEFEKGFDTPIVPRIWKKYHGLVLLVQVALRHIQKK